MYLRDYRKAKGLIMKALGKIVGCTEATIANYENNRRSPDYEMMLRLSEALDCTVDELLRGKNEKSPASEDARLKEEVVSRIVALGLSEKDLDHLINWVKLSELEKSKVDSFLQGILATH